jgi:hypothetical protein
MEEYLVEKSGREKYIIERNGRSSQKWKGIVAFCTCQWNEKNELKKIRNSYWILLNQNSHNSKLALK